MKHWIACAIMIALTGCAASFPPVPDDRKADRAQALLDASIEAHGGYLFEKEGLLNVQYDGEWGKVVKVLQPVLVDADFRKQSEESLNLQTGTLIQKHIGPGGTKRVERSPSGIEVRYNGQQAKDDEVLAAAALVADAYTLFISGPSFARWRGASLALLDDAMFDGNQYHRVLAQLTPGFGLSDEDELVLWIDPETRRVKLAHFTIDGLASTRGAHVDVIFSDYTSVDGYIFPTGFVERVRAPLRVTAHTWSAEGIHFSKD